MSRGEPAASGRRPVPRLALTRREAAEALGMSVDHFDRHVRLDLACVYSGRLRLYAVSELERWLVDHGVPPGRGGTG